jgi:hypothetical protein
LATQRELLATALCVEFRALLAARSADRDVIASRRRMPVIHKRVKAASKTLLRKQAERTEV